MDSGAHGKGKNQRGRNGADGVIKVPFGTEIWERVNRTERRFVADIVDTNPVLVAHGGVGGLGNARYVSSTNQEPVLAERGETGERVILFLELKLLADVGLLARPNAGKSTLISRCTAAKPKVADYPFTTVDPILGVVAHRDKDFVMMEIPGLLEGASRGVGLGQEFLRHAERARVYVHLLDGTNEDPVADYQMLNKELEQFNPDLLSKPQIIAVNKIDVTEVREAQQDIASSLAEAAKEWESSEPPPIVFISGATGEGVDSLLSKIISMLEVLPKDIPDSDTETPPPVVRRRTY